MIVVIFAIFGLVVLVSGGLHVRSCPASALPRWSSTGSRVGSPPRRANRSPRAWFGLRVARPDGTPPGSLRGVVVRSWLPAAVALLIPVRALAALLALFDAAGIWAVSRAASTTYWRTRSCST